MVAEKIEYYNFIWADHVSTALPLDGSDKFGVVQHVSVSKILMKVVHRVSWVAINVPNGTICKEDLYHESMRFTASYQKKKKKRGSQHLPKNVSCCMKRGTAAQL